MEPAVQRRGCVRGHRRPAARRAGASHPTALRPDRRPLRAYVEPHTQAQRGPASGRGSSRSRARSSSPSRARQGRRGGHCGTACRTSRCGRPSRGTGRGRPSRGTGRGRPEPPACSGCLMSSCGCCTARGEKRGWPGRGQHHAAGMTNPAVRSGHGPARCPLQEVTGARGEGQADRCRVWSGLVGGVPPARVLGPAGFPVSRPTWPGAAGAPGCRCLRATCAG